MNELCSRLGDLEIRGGINKRKIENLPSLKRQQIKALCVS